MPLPSCSRTDPGTRTLPLLERAASTPSPSHPAPPCMPLSIGNVSRNLPVPGSVDAVRFGPAFGGGQLIVCRHVRNPSPLIPEPVAELARQTDLREPDASLPDARRSGEQLRAAWREVLDQWIYRLAAGLHDDVNVQATGRGGPPLQWSTCIEVARSWLQGSLPQILESTDPEQLFGVEGPLPQRLRDAVLQALDVEIVAFGTLRDEQLEQVDTSLARVYALLRGPAHLALRTEPLLRLFSSLHAAAMRMEGEAPAAETVFRVIELR